MSAGGFAKTTLVRPMYLFFVFVAVGLGTILLKQPVRLAILWSTLALLGGLYRSYHEVRIGFSPANIGRGAVFGAVIAVPVLAFFSEPLRAFTERLYATTDAVMIFYQVCFVAAPVEEYFFRGILQPRLGSSPSLGLYVVAMLVYFVPHVPFLAAIIAVVALGILGIVCSGVSEQYGLAAAIACHVVVTFTLQVVPSLIAPLRTMTF
jgi:membrane protease YdiL (CAAX protease family)